MKVTVKRAFHHWKFGVVTEGEHDIPDEWAEKFIKSGWAARAEPAPANELPGYQGRALDPDKVGQAPPPVAADPGEGVKTDDWDQAPPKRKRGK